MCPEGVDATLHVSRKRSGWTALATPPSRTAWRVINAAEGFPQLEGGGYSLSSQKIKPLQMGKKANTLGGDLRRASGGGGGSSPQTAPTEKGLSADRRVHSPRLVSAGVLSGILMARGFSAIQGSALSLRSEPTHQNARTPERQPPSAELPRNGAGKEFGITNLFVGKLTQFQVKHKPRPRLTC